MGRITWSAGHALKEERRHAAAVALLGGVALAVLLPILALASPERPAGTALALSGVPSSGADIAWTPEAAPPAALREAALHDAFLVLSVLGWIALGIALVVMAGRTLAALAGRAPDFGIRRAVGASRRDIVGALLLEAAAVLALTLALGGVAAWFLAGRAVAAWPGGVAGLRFAPWLPIALVAATVVLGWLSALRFIRGRHMVSPADPHVSLWIPALQLAVAVAVLAGGWLVLRGGPAAATAPPASGARGGFVMALDTGELTASERSRRYADLLDGLDADSTVALASLGAPGGLLGLGTVDDIMTDCGNCMGVAGVWMPFHDLEAVHHFASPDTFAAQEIPVVEGRAFTAGDRAGSEPVVVVNRHLAGRHFEGGRAVGRGLWLRTGFLVRRPYTVIGVVDDDRAQALGGATPPREALYLATLQHPPARAELLVRPQAGAAEPDARATALATAALGGVGTVGPPARENDLRDAERRALRWFGAGFAIAGVATLLVAVVGVFGTMRLWVRSHAFELALRRAVGATRTRLAAALYGRAAVMTLGALALGALLFAIVVRGMLSLIVPALPLWSPGLFRPLAVLLGGVTLVAVTSALLPLLGERPATRLQ